MSVQVLRQSRTEAGLPHDHEPRADSDRLQQSRTHSGLKGLDKDPDPLGLRPVDLQRGTSFGGGDETEYIKECEDRQANALFFEDTKYKSEVLGRLNTLRRSRELCDVVLYVNHREIYAHQAVLASLSPKLGRLLSTDIVPPVTANGTTPLTHNTTLNTKHENSSAKEGSDEESNNQNCKPKFTFDVQELDEAVTNCQTTAVEGARHGETPVYVEYPRVDYECFEAIVNYAYTSRIEVPPAKVAELYRTACDLRVESVARKCADYLAQHLRPDNCIGIRRSANKASDVYLMDVVDRYIQDHLHAIIETSVEFSALPRIQAQLLGTNMNVASDTQDIQELQDSLCDEHWSACILDRLQHTQMQDGKHFRLEMLTDKTHMYYLDADQQLQDAQDMHDNSSVGSCDLVQDYKKMEQHRNVWLRRRSLSGATHTPVNMANTNTALPVNNGMTPNLSQTNMCHSQPASQLPSGACTPQQKLLASGLVFRSQESLQSNSNGSSGADDTDEIECKLIAHAKVSDTYTVALCVIRRHLAVLSVQMMPRSTALSRGGGQSAYDERIAYVHRCLGGRSPLMPMLRSRCSGGAVMLPTGFVFVSGGYDRGECMSSVEQFSLERNQWLPCADMRSVRGRFDCTLCEGRVYAVGGSDGTDDLATVEMYDPIVADWRSVSSLKTPRSHNGCASVDGRVYCIGGWNGQRALKECEVYAPDTDQWTSIPHLPSGRYQSGVCSWRSAVLVVGGCDQWQCTSDVFHYDTHTLTWSLLATLPSARRGSGAVVVNDKLYVIGGSDGQASLASCDVLDLASGQWTSLADMGALRANVAVCVLPDAQRIAAVGGYNGKTFLNTLEILDINQNEWRSYVYKPVPVPEPIEEALDDVDDDMLRDDPHSPDEDNQHSN